MKLVKSISKSISFRLFIILTGTLTIVFAIYAYNTIRNQSDQMMDMVVYHANTTADLIRSSIHHSMQLDRKEDAYRIIQTIGNEPEVVNIRLYNKEGVITYSTDPEEVKSEVDIYAEACVICHDITPPLYSIPYENRWRIIQANNSGRILELTTVIQNDLTCYGSGCHPGPDEVTVLGVLDVMVSLQSVDLSIGHVRNRMVKSGIILIVVISSLFGILLNLTIRKPVQILTKGTKEVASGNLGCEIPYNSEDELGELAKSFNQMTRELKEAHDEITEWSETLEEKVRQKTEALKKTQAQLIQIEKMASLGTLSASVAHELNNPLEGILTYTKLIAKRLKKIQEPSDTIKEIIEDIELIIKETERSGNIVKNLLLFSRKGAGEFTEMPLNVIINNATKLIQHHLKISNIELKVNLPDANLTIKCIANQIEQALVALIVNSVEAMPDGGIITIIVEKTDDKSIKLELVDTGTGIAAEDLTHIFEPFFTRKESGKGVGLGLSIVYGIIERHGGEILVESVVGRGTKFTLILPMTGID